MTIQSSGPLKLSDVAAEFEMSTPYKLTDLYGTADGIPSSGQLKLTDFYGVSAVRDLSFELRDPDGLGDSLRVTITSVVGETTIRITGQIKVTAESNIEMHHHNSLDTQGAYTPIYLGWFSRDIWHDIDETRIVNHAYNLHNIYHSGRIQIERMDGERTKILRVDIYNHTVPMQYVPMG